MKGKIISTMALLERANVMEAAPFIREVHPELFKVAATVYDPWLPRLLHGSAAPVPETAVPILATIQLQLIGGTGLAATQRHC